MLTGLTLVRAGLGLGLVTGELTGESELLHGPLEGRHRDHGATFAPFGGWLMPVSYAGTVGEHTSAGSRSDSSMKYKLQGRVRNL